jgi:hypothetical protein
LRLVRLVRQALKDSNVNHLVRDINQASSSAGSKCRVSRNLIAKLVKNPESVGLTWNHLVAFHLYFREHGCSLQHVPLLETRGVFEALGDTKRLVFMYGAKPRPEEKRTDNSHWDTEAHGELVQQVSLAGKHLNIEAQHVLWRSPVQPDALRNETWYHLLDEDKASVISIGSPLAALSSEIMLARMFGVTPFEAPHVTSPPVPFYFVWLHKIAANYISAFGLRYRDLDDQEVAKRVQRSEATAVRFENATYHSPTRASQWTMYGFIAAQRRAAGNIWLVVAGLHGPATYGAATMVKEITEELPWSSRGPFPVLWVPVKVEVRAGEGKATDGDIREVTGAEFHGQPRIWPPPQQRS